MATFWVSTSGTDTASGTNYVNAVKTIRHGVNIATQVGDIVNVVNDGTHLMTSSASQYTTPNGTGWNTPGLIIQGTDASGDPAKTTVAATTGQANQFIYMRGGASYWLIRGLKFDLSPIVNSTTVSRIIQFRDNTAGPVRLRYCEFIGSTNTSRPAAVRNVLYQTSTAATNFADISHCYFRNMRLPLSTQSTCGNVVDNCVFLQYFDEYFTPQQWTLTVAASTKVQRMHQCTIAMIADYNGGTLLEAQALPYGWGVNTGNAYFDLYDNLIGIGNLDATTNVAIDSVVAGVNASGATAQNTTYGYNYWAMCDNVAATGAWGNGGIYQAPWDQNATDTSVDGIVATDVLTQAVTFSDIFQDYTGTYTWECTSTTEWQIEVPDLRAKVGTTADSDSGQVGALPAANTAPTANPDTYSVTAGETLNITAGSGVLANDTDPEMATLTAVLVTDVTTGTLSLSSDGSFTYVTSEHYAGSVTFTYKAYDGVTYSNVTTATINCATKPTIDPGTDPPAPVLNPAYIDSRPFFEPTMRLDARVKLQLKKNRRVWSDERGRIKNIEWSEDTVRKLDMTTNTTQTINMGGVETGEYLCVQASNPIKVAVGNATYFWPQSTFLILAGGSYQTLTFNNPSTTNTATVLVAVVD